jgi:methionyl-tRNA formyltransferase
LRALEPDADVVVFSFREESHEPPFLDDIRSFAQEARMEFVEARQVGAPAIVGVWEREPLDLLLAVNWRYVVPPAVFTRARRGAFVFHDSLLPRYRGFSPTVWAMVNGEASTGATMLHMAENYDAGDIVDQDAVAISGDDTIASVMGRVTQLYDTLLRRNLAAIKNGTASRHAQDHSSATYACKRLPEDNEVQWTLGTTAIHNLIRAVTKPYPGAFTTLDGRRVRVWSARPLDDAPAYAGRVPGRVVGVSDQGAMVLTGDGTLLVRELGEDGETPMAASMLLNRLGQTLGR